MWGDKQAKLHLEHSLPYCDLQNAEMGGFYYKVVTRLRQEEPGLAMRLGMKVGEFGRAQQDHVSYLVQLINSSSELYKLVVLGTHFLYLERVGCIF